MGLEASINKTAGDCESHAGCVSNPVIHISTSVKVRLDEFNHSSEDARSQKNWEQAKAASSGKGEGQSCKGDEVRQSVAPIWHRWRGV